jgi:hypothetical protein
MRSISFAFLLVAVAGCGGDSRPAAVPTGGKVAYRKSTIPVGALVVFHPTDPATEKVIGGKPFAKVKDDGTFELTTYSEGDGAPPGEYGITIDWRGAPKAGAAPADDGEVRSGGPSKLAPKYSNPRQPFTKVTVKKGDANRFTFDVD